MSRAYLRKNKMKRINWGGLRRLTPFSNTFGFDRGTPIDRYYIEKFLKENKTHIRGKVLEITDRVYTNQFGEGRVSCSDVLDIDVSNEIATTHADLRDTKALPKNKYDCILLTQTVNLIDNYQLVIKNVHYMLKKKGVLLCTLPSLSRLETSYGKDHDFWRFTGAAARYIFQNCFAKDKLKISIYGNIFTNICFLLGISKEEITIDELEYYDKNFPLIVGVRAVK